MKSGTTFLHALLERHPDVLMSYPKEPHYFSKDFMWSRQWQYVTAPFGTQERLDKYLSLFPSAEKYTVVGESSTTYSRLPQFADVPMRMHGFNPDARLIYIIRDPVERTLSHYWHNVVKEGETRDPETAILGEGEYIDVSYYASQLLGFLRYFAKEQIYIMTMEEFLQDVPGSMTSLFAWLGLRHAAVATGEQPPKNQAADVVFQDRGARALTKLYDKVTWRKRSGSPVFAAVEPVARVLAKRRVVKHNYDDSHIKIALRSIQKPQVEELEDMLGRNLKLWHTVLAA